MDKKGKMMDIYTYCPHTGNVDAFCTKCSAFLCKKCQVEFHYEHIENIDGLDAQLSDAIKEYTQMSSSIEKNLNRSKQCFNEGFVDETLLSVEKRITEEYEKLHKEIKEIENNQVDLVHGSSLASNLQENKNELEGEELKNLAIFDKELDATISQLLSALNNDKCESVEHLLQPSVKEGLTKQAQQFESYYDKQRQFIKKLETYKAIKPQISYNSQTIEELVQIKGVHEEVLKMLVYDNGSRSVFAELPKTKTIVKYDLMASKLPKKQAQVVVEEQLLLLCGGKKKPNTYFKSVHIYSEIESKLFPKADMLEERAYHGIACKKGLEIYVVGGENSNGLLNTAEVYDVKNNVWKALPSLKEAKKNIAVCLCGDKHLYAIGGYADGEIATIEIFNTDGGKNWWEKQIKGANGIQKAGAIAVSDIEIIVFGGIAGGAKTNLSYSYDLKNEKATIKGIMPEASSFNRSDTRLIDGMVYATGNHKGRTFIYDIKLNQWNLLQEKDYLLKYHWD